MEWEKGFWLKKSFIWRIDSIDQPVDSLMIRMSGLLTDEE